MGVVSCVYQYIPESTALQKNLQSEDWFVILQVQESFYTWRRYDDIYKTSYPVEGYEKVILIKSSLEKHEKNQTEN